MFIYVLSPFHLSTFILLYGGKNKIMTSFLAVQVVFSQKESGSVIVNQNFQFPCDAFLLHVLLKSSWDDAIKFLSQNCFLVGCQLPSTS